MPVTETVTVVAILPMVGVLPVMEVARDVMEPVMVRAIVVSVVKVDVILGVSLLTQVVPLIHVYLVRIVFLQNNIVLHPVGRMSRVVVEVGPATVLAILQTVRHRVSHVMPVGKLVIQDILVVTDLVHGMVLVSLVVIAVIIVMADVMVHVMAHVMALVMVLAMVDAIQDVLHTMALVKAHAIPVIPVSYATLGVIHIAILVVMTVSPAMGPARDVTHVPYVIVDAILLVILVVMIVSLVMEVVRGV